LAYTLVRLGKAVYVRTGIAQAPSRLCPQTRITLPVIRRTGANHDRLGHVDRSPPSIESIRRSASRMSSGTFAVIRLDEAGRDG
jgi:hypothetical protein